MDILIAEDDAVARELWAEVLTAENCRPICCSDGEAAYNLLTTTPNRFDLVLTDVIMPRLDGRDLVKRLRQLEQYRKTPVIIVSSIIGPKEIYQLLSQGATYYLAKPVRTADLIDLVNRCRSDD